MLLSIDNSTVKNSLLDFLRKEVIQPHLPIRLPCYDFTPVIEPAFDSSFLTVRSLASGIPNSHGVTGGVYKTRERIHLSLIHISEPTRQAEISYAVFCLKKKKKK